MLFGYRLGLKVRKPIRCCRQKATKAKTFVLRPSRAFASLLRFVPVFEPNSTPQKLWLQTKITRIHSMTFSSLQKCCTFLLERGWHAPLLHLASRPCDTARFGREHGSIDPQFCRNLKNKSGGSTEGILHFLFENEHPRNLNFFTTRTLTRQ